MDIKKDVQQQFGKNAASYVSSPIHKDGKDLLKMIEMAVINGQEELLDIATGGGHTANAFAPLVKKVTAVDLTEELLAAAESFITENGHQNVEFVQGDAEQLPITNESFDIVTCRIAPHHFPNVDLFIKEVYRVLKPGGQFLLDDNVVPEWKEYDQFYNTIEKIRDYSHFRAWKKSEWIQKLEDSGLEVFEWHRFEKTFQFESWCANMKLPELEKIHLTKFILESSDKIKDKFRILIQDEKIISFNGEAIILKALKRI
ncbi:ubiquinone/menaquinone biosynthesis C-methylase UbiE [Bacillus niacini]|uniref:Ubiquinone/menaquinone biosynthesis C-methylase UbiE n=1 Tax=Neobacillus niacini TaxID=86668 RepID=A0A852TQ58_9BACI|nr:class I SAM-dependent methyltransferase [Neobacillus niacini]NYE09188.1 ubiquinone/menaquinone biosynthesis C-methylase UbiE [Neobacillus niacini]